MASGPLRNTGLELLRQALHCHPEKALQIESVLGEHLQGPRYVEQVVRTALHLTPLTMSGYYSLIFNDRLDQLTSQLARLSAEDFFPEVYRNPLLSLEERAELIDRHQLEYAALRESFENGSKEVSPQFFRHNLDSELNDLSCSDLYSRAFNRMVLEDRLRENGNVQSLDQNTLSGPVDRKVFTEQCSELIMEHCLPTKDLLRAFLKDGLHPLTGRPLPESLLQELQTELKLVEYALSVLSLERTQLPG